MMADVNQAEGTSEKPKSKAQLKKEAKKKDKLEKFNAKMEKKEQMQQQKGNEQNAAGKKEKKAKEKSKADAAILYTADTAPGVKKDISGPMPESYSPRYVEAAWYSWWEKSGFFTPEYGAPAEGPDNREQFMMVIPPPNVTGSLHLGHALTNSVEDALTRWHRMCGHRTLWNPGCDHAGIATQVVVEKKIKREQGLSRHDLGREGFLKEVWKWKEEKGDRIYKQLRMLGSSCDWNRARFTMEPVMYRAVTESFVRLHADRLIYRARRLVNWSCSLRSAISDIEVEKKELEGRTMLRVPGYAQPVEFGVLVSFAYPVMDGADGEEIVVATTRIETMLGDTAVAVHPEDPRYKHLHGKKVRHPLLPDLAPLPIVLDEFVDREFGSGAVKITPAHDHNDFGVGQRHNLPFRTVITEGGTMTNDCGDFSGVPRFEARVKVLEALKAKGVYRDTKENPMTLPMCSRSKDVIEPLIKPQWYLSCKEMAADAIKAVESGDLEIIPKDFHGTWYAWLRDIREWCISRQLWWGHRIPAYLFWRRGASPPSDTSADEAWIVARTEEEARKAAGQRLGCPEAEVELQQDEDVLDTWYSSQLFPFAIFGWPDNTPDLQRFFPGSLLETGHDILFFWVARMVFMGQRLMGELPFKQVYLHAMVRDAHGRKMSKSLGNVIDPLDVIFGITLADLHKTLEGSNLDAAEIARAQKGQQKDYPQGIPECGADALRFALCAYTAQCRDINLDVLRVQGYRFFCNKMWNATRFALLHALGEDFRPPTERGDPVKDPEASATDRWILSRLAGAVEASNRGMAAFDFTTATSAIHAFWLYDLCDVYLEYAKPAIKDGSSARQALVRHVLYTCLDAALRLIHPFMPFVSEELFQRLPRRKPDSDPPSICVTRYPNADEFGQFRDPGLEAAMDLAQKVLKSVRSLRADYRLVPRQQTHPHIVCTDRNTQETLAPFLLNTIGVLSNSSQVTSHLGEADLPPGCVVATVTGQVAVHLPLQGLIDPEKEAARLSSSQARLAAQLDKLRKDAARPDYDEKVPANVREANAAKLADGEAELARLSAALASLRLMGGDGDSAAWLLTAPHRELPLLLPVRLAAACAGLSLRFEPASEWRLTGPGGEALNEPGAMAEALAGGGPLRGGSCPEQRALVTQWSSWAALQLWPEAAKALKRGGRQRSEQLSRVLAVFEAHLKGRQCAVGDAPTLADLHLLSAVTPLWRFVLSAKEQEAFPNVRRWAAGLMQVEPVAKELSQEERNLWK